MILMCILLAMVVEFYYKIPESNRRFIWFNDIATIVEKRLSASGIQNPWVGTMIKLLPIPVILHFVIYSTDGFLFWVLGFLLSTFVLVHCLGPEILKLRYEHYFECIKRGDYEAGFLSLGEDLGDIELEALPGEVTQLIFRQVNCNYFAVLIWFILLGAPGALFYRLFKIEMRRNPEHAHLNGVENILDWIPSRILALTFALVGNFQRALPELKACLLQMECKSQVVIYRVGLSALDDYNIEAYDRFSENRHAIELMERALLGILVFTAFLTMGGLVS